MHCTNCGAKLPENANFCVACGTKVVVDITIGVQPRPARQHVSWRLGMVVGVCIVAVASILMWQSTKPADSSSDVAVGGELDDSALADAPFGSGNSSESSTWDRTLGEPDFEYGISAMQISDGGYFVAGLTRDETTSNRSTWLIMTDPYGNPMWDTVLPEVILGYVRPVSRTQDGGYVITGGRDGVGVTLAKADAAGNLVWVRHLTSDSDWVGESVVQTCDGGYAIVGSTETLVTEGDPDILVMKTDSDGRLQWCSTLGGQLWDSGSSIGQTSDGGFIVVGTSKSYGAENACIVLLSLDPAGNEQWHNIYDGPFAEVAGSFVQAHDGGYVLCGATNSYEIGRAHV